MYINCILLFIGRDQEEYQANQVRKGIMVRKEIMGM